MGGPLKTSYGWRDTLPKYFSDDNNNDNRDDNNNGLRFLRLDREFEFVQNRSATAKIGWWEKFGIWPRYTFLNKLRSHQANNPR